MKGLYTISSIISILVTLCRSPLSFVLLVIFQCLTVCLVLFFFGSSSWFSYILFLVFLGGMMVIFIYISSLASNELVINLSVSGKDFFFFFFFFFGFGFNVLIFKFDVFYMFSMGLSLCFSISLFSMIYLFFTLLVITEVSNIQYGPLRANKFF